MVTDVAVLQAGAGRQVFEMAVRRGAGVGA